MKKLRNLLLLLSQPHDEHPGFKLCDWVLQLQGFPQSSVTLSLEGEGSSYTRRSQFLEEVREVTPARRLSDQRAAAEIQALKR